MPTLELWVMSNGGPIASSTRKVAGKKIVRPSVNVPAPVAKVISV